MLPPLHRRILEISYRNKSGHIGSCLGVVDLLDAIYADRKPDEPVILSCGHAGLGLYVVLEKHLGKNAEDLFKRHGVHPNRNLEDGVYCSTGSLAQGITVAVGHALANRGRRVWCVISDGELAEGAVYEALTFAARAGLTNLRVYVAANGYSAYQAVPVETTYRLVSTLFSEARVQARPVETFGIPFLTGMLAHYYIMKDPDWQWVLDQDNVPTSS